MNSRRRFLKQLGLGAAAGTLASWVPMFDREAEATGEYPRRLVLFHTGNGTIHDAWKPSGSPTDWSPSRILTPLDRHRDRLVVMNGIHQRVFDVGTGRPHARAAAQLLTGRPLTSRGEELGTRAGGGISVDQLVASRVGSATPFPFVSLGVSKSGDFCFRGAESPVPGENDPREAFTTLFSGFDPSSVDGGSADALRARRDRVFGVVNDQLARVRDRIGATERYKLDAHLDAVDGLSRRLDDLAMRTTCTVPDLETDRITAHVKSSEMYPVVMDLQMELATAALTCDLTRVVTILCGSSGNTHLYPVWLGISDQHHTIGHEARRDATFREKNVRVEEWHAERFASFLDMLAAVDEGGPGESLLDHSIVVWINSMGQGDHTMEHLPIVVAGSGGGVLRTGRYLDFAGVPHNDFLTSLCHLMGLDDVDVFGDPSIGTGPLSGI